MPTLSICIATLNRGDVIGETLESIVAQVTDDVEVVVLDGASRDNTAEVVDGYRRRCPRLRYVRLAANGGVDRDYDRAVQESSGEYCWLMSDDDILAPGAVEAVLGAARRLFSLIIVNADVRSRDMSEVIEARRLKLDQDRVYTPGQLDEFFVEAAEYMSFIGCVVIRRDIWLERDRERYFGTAFIHMGVVFQAPLPGDIVIVAQPHIRIRFGNAQWTAREFEIWMFKWPGLLWSFDCVGTPARAAVSSAEPWRKLSTLVFYRAKGTYSIVEYRTWLEPRLASGLARWSARAVARIPGVLANGMALLYAAASGRFGKMVRIQLEGSPYYVGRLFGSGNRR